MLKNFKIKQLKNTLEKKFKKIDFSGGKDSWFDFWHTHADWDGEGNKNWSIRENYLNELLKIFNFFCEQMEAYPFPYQVWIEIYEKDSSDDAVYIHTKNPNSDNFPLRVKSDKKVINKNNKLEAFINQTGLSTATLPLKNGIVILLYDKSIGVPL